MGASLSDASRSAGRAAEAFSCHSAKPATGERGRTNASPANRVSIRSRTRDACISTHPHLPSRSVGRRDRRASIAPRQTVDRRQRSNHHRASRRSGSIQRVRISGSWPLTDVSVSRSLSQPATDRLHVHHMRATRSRRRILNPATGVLGRPSGSSRAIQGTKGPLDQCCPGSIQDLDSTQRDPGKASA